MKISILLFALILFGACKRHTNKPADPAPQLQVTFGCMNVLFFERFWNQDSIRQDSMAMLHYLGIELEEKDLSKSVYDIDNNNLALAFDIFTNGDKEHYVTRQNVNFIIGLKSGSNDRANFSASGFIPMKVSINPKPYNDTLEFSSLGDCVKIDYASQYANVRTRDSLFVKP